MYLFQGKVKDLLPDIETKMKLNAIQQMLDDTGMLAYELPVTHDVQPENEIIINSVWCDIGSHKVSEDDLVAIAADATVCESCYEHYA